MTKSYEGYARQRRAQLSKQSKHLLVAFGAAREIGAAISQARTERRMTQIQLAKASGVSQADISRIECGALMPTTPTMLKILKALNVRMNLELQPTHTRKRSANLVTLTRSDGSSIA